MERGKVSIITPTYNCGAFIEETIRSVQHQTYRNWELIIVDDCSTDNTEEIVKQFLSEDSRIRYFRLDSSSGAAVARNVALRKVSGEWIAFLDSDDLWDDKKLETQLVFMEEKGISFSYTPYREINEQSEETGVIVRGPKRISKLGMWAYCWPGCLTVMYNADKVPLLQIPTIRKNNDYIMWLKLIRYMDCYLCPDILASYRKRSGSISNQSKLSLVKWHYNMFKALGCSDISSIWHTFVNLICGVFKKIVYVSNN